MASHTTNTPVDRNGKKKTQNLVLHIGLIEDLAELARMDDRGWAPYVAKVLKDHVKTKQADGVIKVRASDEFYL